MRTIKSVEVSWAILHLVSPAADGFELSTRALDLEPTLAGFLARHIENGLTDGGARSARFRSTDQGDVATWCRRIAAGHETDRVADSSAAAERLQEIIRGDKRIAPGAFVLAVFHDAADATCPALVGLIKFDPGSAFRSTRRSDKDGSYLTLEMVTNTLPTTRERLQKAAFVNPADETEFLVLDRQVSGPSATFFLDGFLAAELLNDDTVLTERLVAALKDSFNEVADNKDPEHAEKFRVSQDGLLTAPTVDLNSWLPTLDAYDREVAERHLDDNNVEKSFALDQTVLKRRRRLVRYEGDHGLQVSVDPNFQGMITRHEASGPLRWRIEILTNQWQLK